MSSRTPGPALQPPATVPFPAHPAEAVPNITTAQLIDCLHLADSCELEALAGACIGRLASRLLAELPWPEPVASQLGGCCASTLISLMGRMAASSAAVQEGKVAAALAQQKRAADAALAEVKRAGEAARALQKQAANAALAEQTSTAQVALAEQRRAAEVAVEEKQKAEAALAEQMRTVETLVQHLHAVKAPPLALLDSTFSGSNTCVFELEVFDPACLPPPRWWSDGVRTHKLFLAGLMWDVSLAASPLPGSGCAVYGESCNTGWHPWSVAPQVPLTDYCPVACSVCSCIGCLVPNRGRHTTQRQPHQLRCGVRGRPRQGRVQSTLATLQQYRPHGVLPG